MRKKDFVLYPVWIGLLIFGLVTLTPTLLANIDPVNKWAWSTNAGWLNFAPTQSGVVVYNDHLEGFAWGENIGWIKFGSHTGGGTHTYNNTNDSDYGVNVDSGGNLSGYAWSNNVGWIKFNPVQGGVTIDDTGSFDGFAWSENIGWIHFRHTDGVTYNVQANLPDLVLSKTVTPTTARPGEVITYVLHIENMGSGPALGIVLTDIVPMSFTLQTIGSYGLMITQTSGNYIWAVENLAAGTEGVITLTGILSQPLAAGNMNNMATIATTALEPNLDNNFDSVSLTVINVPPLANDDLGSGYVTNEDTPFSTTNVFNNDGDDNGDALIFVDFDDSASNGLVSYNQDGTFNYMPNGQYETLAVGETGFDTFSYTISDSVLNDTATVTLTLTGVNDTPIANNDAYTVPINSQTIFTVLNNDSDIDNGDTLQITNLTTPNQGGSVFILNNTRINYAPATDFSGTETFSYTVDDGNGGDTFAVVTVVITGVNNLPIAGADTFTVAEDSLANSLAVTLNDTDADGDTLTISQLGALNNDGTATYLDATISYTPATNFNGLTVFTYTVTDPYGGQDTTDVTVTVTPVNDAPIANNDHATTLLNTSITIPVLSNDSDIDGDTLIISDIDPPANGQTISQTMYITYTPASNFTGTDIFTYTVIDNQGGEASATVIVTTTTSISLPNLSLNKQVSGLNGNTVDLPLGSAVTYTINLHNNGTALATSVHLTDTLPNGIRFEGWQAQHTAQITANTITWSGILSPAYTLTLAFTGAITNTSDFAGQTITNTVEASGNNIPLISNQASFSLSPPQTNHHVYLPVLLK